MSSKQATTKSVLENLKAKKPIYEAVSANGVVMEFWFVEGSEMRERLIQNKSKKNCNGL